MARRPVVALALAVAAWAIAACGGGDDTTGPSGPDPAALVPADAPVYVDAVVRPEGDQADEVDSALSKLLVTDDVSGKLRAIGQLDAAEPGATSNPNSACQTCAQAQHHSDGSGDVAAGRAGCCGS